MIVSHGCTGYTLSSINKLISHGVFELIVCETFDTLPERSVLESCDFPQIDLCS